MSRMKLGFGFMRLPRRQDGSTDLELIRQMTDRFIEAGGTYFDTAFTYGTDGDSETAIRDAVVRRWPRDRFTIATKVNAGKAKDEDDAKAQFYTSLERMEAGYIDYYLLHGIQIANVDLYESYHLWDFIKQRREEELIRNIGFSFHSSPEMLERILDAHPETDFVQLQINYADWDNPNVNAGRCYEIVHDRGIPITVMEPVKGGGLANPNPAVQKLFRDANPKASFASWAIRYAASLDGILAVLSGMSDLSQMEDNLSFMKDFQPITDSEREVILKAQEALKEDNQIACTACHYCTPGCPKQIAIPELFASVNEYERYHDRLKYLRNSGIATRNGGTAADCIRCGQCERACPQHLPIIRLLAETQEQLKQLAAVK